MQYLLREERKLAKFSSLANDFIELDQVCSEIAATLESVRGKLAYHESSLEETKQLCLPSKPLRPISFNMIRQAKVKPRNHDSVVESCSSLSIQSCSSASKPKP